MRTLRFLLAIHLVQLLAKLGLHRAADWVGHRSGLHQALRQLLWQQGQGVCDAAEDDKHLSPRGA
jgi:hypothetical protein